jgi:hypothetical protein
MSESAAKAMPPGLVVLLLALLLGIQPVTTDLYLPALPALTTELGATVGQGQLTLTALLLCLWPVAAGLWPAVGPLWPPAHPAGRAWRCTRVAGVACMLATSIEC